MGNASPTPAPPARRFVGRELDPPLTKRFAKPLPSDTDLDAFLTAGGVAYCRRGCVSAIGRKAAQFCCVRLGLTPMIIRNLATAVADTRINSATIEWEDQAYPPQVLNFETDDRAIRDVGQLDEPCADAFLAACFPLAALHGEARVRIEGRPCPMLVEGLRTAHAWWASWGGMPSRDPTIEVPARGRRNELEAPRRAVSCLSGGVDGLHLLMQNRRLYRQGDPAYIREVLFIHGFDIGKRARDPESERFNMALRRLEPVAAEAGVRLVPCRTNLRHLPSKPDFWTYRHNGAALAAVGHSATLGPAFLFIAASHQVANPVPMGSHPAVDCLFSSQRVAVIHDGGRFSRLEKVRDLASWPTALAALRVCPARLGDGGNCGRCEKCLRTRLELLAAGVDQTSTFGPSLTPIELWEEAVPTPTGHRAIMYEDLLPPLRARGHNALCRMLEEKIVAYRERVGEGVRWPSLRSSSAWPEAA
jgi:hypothetical protein